MCPAHRSEVLNKIRHDLANNIPCTLISTSVIEAGVDIDFQTTYRAFAGLDSIIQTAGRCNREGKQTKGNVYIFSLRGEYVDHIRSQISASKHISRKFRDDFANLNAINLYFRELYGNKHLDAQKSYSIFANCKDLYLPFRECHFSVIPDQQQHGIIIPYNSEARGLIERLEEQEDDRDVLRKLQRYIINVYATKDKLLANRIKLIGDKNSTTFLLTDINAYDKMTGLNLNGDIDVG
jgi:CRISPR-associated endonuclease/helicase Cas3